MSRASWTWLVYMAGDNDLAGEAELDLAEMAAANPGDRVRVLALVDTPRQAGCFEITGSGKKELSRVPTANTGDPRVLQGFLAWGTAYAPADNYALVIWNHGSGVEDIWSNPTIYTINPAVRGLLRGPRARRAVVRRPALRRRLFGARTDITRAVAFDRGQGDFLDNVEIQLALTVRPAAGRVALVGFDACLMATAEIAHAIRGSAPVVVASQAEEGRSGWCWSRMVGATVASPHIDGPGLARAMVEAQERFGSTDGLPGLTLSAIDAARVDAAVGPLSRATRGLLPLLAEPAVYGAVLRAWRESPRFDPPCYADADAMLRGLASAVASRAPAVAADLRAADAALRASVLASATRGAWSGWATGLSLYAPTDRAVPEYAQLPFGQVTGWTTLLRALGA